MINDNMIFYDHSYLICYNKQSMANGASGVNILPAPRHVIPEQDLELAHAITPP